MVRVRAIAQELALNKNLVTRYWLVEGGDEDLYVNLMFETTELEEFWRKIIDTMYCDKQIGAALSKSTIAICEGGDGWNDYLLLHHFDPSESVDRLDPR